MCRKNFSQATLWWQHFENRTIFYSTFVVPHHFTLKFDLHIRRSACPGARTRPNARILSHEREIGDGALVNVIEDQIWTFNQPLVGLLANITHFSESYILICMPSSISLTSWLILKCKYKNVLCLYTLYKI